VIHFVARRADLARPLAGGRAEPSGLIDCLWRQCALAASRLTCWPTRGRLNRLSRRNLLAAGRARARAAERGAQIWFCRPVISLRATRRRKPRPAQLGHKSSGSSWTQQSRASRPTVCWLRAQFWPPANAQRWPGGRRADDPRRPVIKWNTLRAIWPRQVSAPLSRAGRAAHLAHLAAPRSGHKSSAIVRVMLLLACAALDHLIAAEAASPLSFNCRQQQTCAPPRAGALCPSSGAARASSCLPGTWAGRAFRSVQLGGARALGWRGSRAAAYARRPNRSSGRARAQSSRFSSGHLERAGHFRSPNKLPPPPLERNRAEPGPSASVGRLSARRRRRRRRPSPVSCCGRRPCELIAAEPGRAAGARKERP